MLTPSATRENRLLAALPDEDRRRIAGHCEPVELPLKMVLLDGSSRADYVYFPTQGLSSVVTTFTDGSQIESTSVGAEGFVGIMEFLATRVENMQVLQQVAGHALRMRTDKFHLEVHRSAAMRACLESYAGLILSESMQSAGCNRLHEAKSRCAKWLLLTAERLGHNEFHLTHEFLATMIGASRPVVSALVGKLESRRLLSQSRAFISIEDPEGLRRLACECHEIVRRRLNDYLSRLKSMPF